MVSLNICKVQVVRSSHGPDYVFLTTDLPSGEYPFPDSAVCKVTVARGCGETWARINFALEPEIIDTDVRVEA